MLFWQLRLQVYAEHHKVDCGSYRGRLRFTRLSLIAEGVTEVRKSASGSCDYYRGILRTI